MIVVRLNGAKQSKNRTGKNLPSLPHPSHTIAIDIVIAVSALTSPRDKSSTGAKSLHALLPVLFDTRGGAN